jgi:threonine dehydrogenase-like Zn-dependent dehydrogenase
MATTRLEISPRETAATTVPALVHRGPEKFSWQSHRRPVLLAPAEAVVRITASTICGSDLYILKKRSDRHWRPNSRSRRYRGVVGLTI